MLLPGAGVPKGHLYSLPEPERKAIAHEYIQWALAAGIVRPTSSPAGDVFFFAEKDKTASNICCIK